MRGWACALLVLLALAGCGGGDEAPTPADAGSFDADRAFSDLKAQVRIGPRVAGTPAAHRTAALIAERLADAGATAVTIQGHWENVVGTLEGDGEGTVIVGAHYDTKDAIPGFVGANDGASGVAVLLELARTLPRPLPGPSVQFVAFDAEEARGDRPFAVDGTRGSRQYVDDARAGGRQGAVPLGQIRAMVLFDLVGDCDLEIPLEPSSDPELYRLFAEASEQLDGDPEPFVGQSGSPVGDDHIPFREQGIPAVDLIDFEFGPGPSPGAYWHTPEDTLDKVCPESLDAVGEAALRAIPRIR